MKTDELMIRRQLSKEAGRLHTEEKVTKIFERTERKDIGHPKKMWECKLQIKPVTRA